MLAYFFPPVGGAGVQRTLKFVRYLEPLGWDATVISTRSRVYGARDSTLLEEVPKTTRVIRTAALPLARYLSIPLYWLRLRRLRAWVLWPDNGLGWAPFAFLAALRAARHERPDVLFSTSVPYGSHLVALLVARLTGIPWVADFRDEWTGNPHFADQPRPLRWLSRRAESAITSRALRTVVTADYFELTGLDKTDPRRVEILNGVDGADFVIDSPRPPPDRFVLTYVGTIYDSIDPTVALRVLAELAARGEVDDRAEVRIVGSIWLPGFAPPPGIRVEVTGYVPHARAVEEMRTATALLLYVPEVRFGPAGKLFEYLASGRPLLCLARPENFASRVVSEWDAGFVAEPDDEPAIKQAILELWRRWEEDGLPDQERVHDLVLERYSRRASTERLAEVLEEARRG
jgi:glycosyltransferase involved in cell wall biosynthesis